MNSILNTPLKDLLTIDIKIVLVLHSHGIVVEGNSEQLICTLFERHKIPDKEKAIILKEINTILFESKSTAIALFQKWPLDQLMAHIEEKHHRFIEKSIPLIKAYFSKVIVSSVFSNSLPELEDRFNRASSDLIIHLKKEELLLFPSIEKLANIAEKGSGLINVAGLKKMTSLMATMHEDHHDELEEFKAIYTQLERWSAVQPETEEILILTKLVQAFVTDLTIHIEKENTIVFEQAIQLQQQLNC